MPKTKSGKPIPYKDGGSGRTISDADRLRLKKMLKARGMRDGGMAEQMSEQMDMSEREAGGLMKKAKRINDADMMNMADGRLATSVVIFSSTLMKSSSLVSGLTVSLAKFRYLAELQWPVSFCRWCSDRRPHRSVGHRAAAARHVLPHATQVPASGDSLVV